MTDRIKTTEDALDAALARLPAPVPSDDFMARVLADAEAMQPRAAIPAPRPRTRGIWFRAMAALGGGLGLAGLGTAAMAGLVIGYVQPDPLLTLSDSFGVTSATASLDLLPGYDALLTEEFIQ